MPVRIKFALSLLVVLVTAIAVYFQHRLGHDRTQYVVAFLGFFMIFAMWLFPEVKRDETAGGVRRDVPSQPST
jgi:membrane protein YdbS with pleckstrin-like domain